MIGERIVKKLFCVHSDKILVIVCTIKSIAMKYAAAAAATRRHGDARAGDIVDKDSGLRLLKFLSDKCIIKIRNNFLLCFR